MLCSIIFADHCKLYIPQSFNALGNLKKILYVIQKLEV